MNPFENTKMRKLKKLLMKYWRSNPKERRSRMRLEDFSLDCLNQRRKKI